jgi:hypothetical protein
MSPFPEHVQKTLDTGTSCSLVLRVERVQVQGGHSRKRVTAYLTWFIWHQHRFNHLGGAHAAQERGFSWLTSFTATSAGDSVNHLLVVGFYLINFGYVCLALKLAESVQTAQASIEALSVKVGMVLLVLGGMHFFNLFIFSRMRRRASLVNGPPPVPPDGYTRVQEA